MDVISLQEAKKASKKVGDLKQLETTAKTDTVSAINELTSQIKGKFKPDVVEMELQVDSGETKFAYMDFISSGFITGIKVTGNDLTGEFNLKIFTKPPDEGGTYLYYSGRIFNIIWDIPENDIPFMDESNVRKIYLALQNKGVDTNFKIQIFVLKV